jgi:hypothetical protein
MGAVGCSSAASRLQFSFLLLLALLSIAVPDAILPPHLWGRTSCITHRDVGSAIAPCNLAAFPPSIEVNAEK